MLLWEIRFQVCTRHFRALIGNHAPKNLSTLQFKSFYALYGFEAKNILVIMSLEFETSFLLAFHKLHTSDGNMHTSI